MIAAVPVLVGLLASLGVWGAYEGTSTLVSTNGFCLSCHEMGTTGAEYEQSVHFSSRTGVRAQCADCHVPKPFVQRVVHMMRASRDVLGHVTGVIDTPAKFEAQRFTMAKRVWAEMAANDSLGCRSCHDREAMDARKQKPEAVKQMHDPANAQKSCIECHHGIAHHLPAPPRPVVVAQKLTLPPAAPAPVPATSAPAPAAPAPAAPAPAAPTSAAAPAPAPAAATAKAFVAQPSVKLSAGPGGAAIGTLYVSAPVNALGAEDGAMHVTARLWMKGEAGDSGPLYGAPKGIELGRLDHAPAANAKPAETRDGYTAIDLDGFLPQEALTASLAPVWEAAEQNYEFTCGACHELYAASKHTPDEWASEMPTMAKNANIQLEDAMLILKWLQNNAQPAPDGAKAASP